MMRLPICNRVLMCSILFFLSIIYCTNGFAEPDLKSIIERYQAEYNRPFYGRMEMRRVKPGKEDRVSVFAVWMKGQDYSLVKFLAPVREKGTAFLKNKDQMYFYLPSVAKVIRISGSQRILDSDFSGANLLGMDLTADYNYELEGDGLIDGVDHYIIVFKAKNRTATYDRVKLWLRKNDEFPKKEEFYTSSGKLLQVLTYDNFVTIGGYQRVKKMTMQNALVSGQYTIVTLLEANYDQQISDEIFTQLNLKRSLKE